MSNPEMEDDIADLIGPAPSSKSSGEEEQSELHKLLIRACPPDPKTGHKSIAILAARIGMTSAGIYRMISKDQILGRRAKQIVELDDCEVEIAEFLPWLH